MDSLDLPLNLSEWNHGWLATIEPDEELGVGLRANPMYPDAPWHVVEFDAAVIDLDDSFSEVTRRESPDDLQSLLPLWVFTFRGNGLGASPLVFEVVVDGERVDVAEFAVAVVEDACASDIGISANRCGDNRLGDESRHWTEWEHGLPISIAPGEDTSVSLTANALYPDGAWTVAEYDPEVVEIQSMGPGSVRTPGDWDSSDLGKPDTFLATSEFVVTGVGSGESPLVFEVVADGRRVDVAEFTVAVIEDA